MEENYESVQETARRLGVTPRAVQKWAAAGRIPGAVKLGRTWFIPKGAEVLKNKIQGSENRGDTAETKGNNSRHAFRQIDAPMLRASFIPGKCEEYIQSIADEDEKRLAAVEYYLYSGQPQKVLQSAEYFLNKREFTFLAELTVLVALRLVGDQNSAKVRERALKRYMNFNAKTENPSEQAVLSLFFSLAGAALAETPGIKKIRLEENLKYLPGGIKLWGCYLLAMKAYFQKDYVRALTIGDTSLMLMQESYPLAEIYIHLSAVASLMRMKRVQDAKERMEKAWALARPDNFIYPFAEEYFLLLGMVEVYFKENNPEVYREIIRLTGNAEISWARQNRFDRKENLIDSLSLEELNIAALYSYGWTAAEIAEYMEISESTIRNRVKSIYTKLGISSRKDIAQFILE